MTELQKRFAEEYVKKPNCQRAGELAGIQGDNIRITGWQMLQLPEVQAYVEQLQAEAAKRCEISMDDLLNEWKKLGFSNIKNYVEDDLTPKNLSNVTDPEVIKSVKKTVIKSDTDTKVVTEFTLHDKINALVNIGKILGYYEKDNQQRKDVIHINVDNQDAKLGE